MPAIINSKKVQTLEWVIADPTCGISFSKSFSHLKNKRKMLSRHAKGYKKPGPANISWWILGESNVPDGLKFIQDPNDKHHYFFSSHKANTYFYSC